MSELWKELRHTYYNANCHVNIAWQKVADHARTLLAKPVAPTDEELEDFINAKMRDPISLVRDALEKFGTCAAPQAEVKPVATREAVGEWLNTKTLPRYFSAEDKDWVEFVLSALSHFAPPASNAPILRMSAWDIEVQMRGDGDDLSSAEHRMIKHCARVAHRLAQPAPVVDPDAGAKIALGRWMRACHPEANGHANDEAIWLAYPQMHEGARAFVTSEKTNGNG